MFSRLRGPICLRDGQNLSIVLPSNNLEYESELLQGRRRGRDEGDMIIFPITFSSDEFAGGSNETNSGCYDRYGRDILVGRGTDIL